LPARFAKAIARRARQARPFPPTGGEGCLNSWDLEEMKKQSASAKAYRYKSHERELPSPFGESLSRKSGGQGEGKKSEVPS